MSYYTKTGIPYSLPHPRLYVTFSVSSIVCLSAMHHILETVHHVIIICGTHL